MTEKEKESLIGQIHFLKCIIQEIKEDVESDEAIPNKSKEKIFSTIRKCTHSY